MTIAYVITSGCYSDYRIEAVFLDKDVAYEYARILNTTSNGDTVDNVDIEEYAVAAEVPTQPYQVSCTIRDGKPEPFHYYADDCDTPFRAAAWSYNPHAFITSCTLRIQGDTYERINKAMTEWVAEYAAQWDVLRYASELRGEIPPPPEPLAHPDMVRSISWHCESCGSGPFHVERTRDDGSTVDEYWKHHAPSCWRLNHSHKAWEDVKRERPSPDYTPDTGSPR